MKAQLVACSYWQFHQLLLIDEKKKAQMNRHTTAPQLKLTIDKRIKLVNIDSSELPYQNSQSGFELSYRELSSFLIWNTYCHLSCLIDFGSLQYYTHLFSLHLLLNFTFLSLLLPQITNYHSQSFLLKRIDLSFVDFLWLIFFEYC